MIKTLKIECDIIQCQYCNQDCGNDTDVQYSSHYQCCEDCVSDVEDAIHSRHEHEADCLGLVC